MGDGPGQKGAGDQLEGHANSLSEGRWGRGSGRKKDTWRLEFAELCDGLIMRNLIGFVVKSVNNEI